MKHPVLDSVSVEQKELNKPWALISVLATLIIFGTFWAIQKEMNQVNIPVIATPDARTENDAFNAEDIVFLQQSLANTAVLEYSSIF